MKRFSVVLSCSLALMTWVAVAHAADANTIEEAFVDAVGTCNTTSKVNAVFMQTRDPAFKRAVRYAAIVEAADDAAAVPGSDKAHSDCVQKELKARGLTQAQLEAIPDCVSQDWPDPLDNLGTCVVHRAKLEGSKKAAPAAE